MPLLTWGYHRSNAQSVRIYSHIQRERDRLATCVEIHEYTNADYGVVVRIGQACDISHYEPNLALNLEVADLINSKKGNA